MPTFTFFGNITNTTNGYWSSVIGKNNFVYLIPNRGPTIIEINPSTDLIQTYGSFSTSSKWNGGVQHPNGFIYFVPFTSSQILKFDLQSKTFSLIGNYSGVSKYVGAGIGQNGNIYFVPSQATSIAKFDPQTEQLTTFGPTLSGYWGCVTVNNKLVMIPRQTTKIAILDMDTEQVTFIGSFSSNVNALFGCLSTNGKIYFHSTTFSKLYELDINTLQLQEVANINGYFLGIVSAPDERIYLVPYHYTSGIVEFNTNTRQVVTYNNGLNPSQENYATGVCVPDYFNTGKYKIYLTPASLSQVLMITDENWNQGFFTSKKTFFFISNSDTQVNKMVQSNQKTDNIINSYFIFENNTQFNINYNLITDENLQHQIQNDLIVNKNVNIEINNLIQSQFNTEFQVNSNILTEHNVSNFKNTKLLVEFIVSDLINKQLPLINKLVKNIISQLNLDCSLIQIISSNLLSWFDINNLHTKLLSTLNVIYKNLDFLFQSNLNLQELVVHQLKTFVTINTQINYYLCTETKLQMNTLLKYSSLINCNYKTFSNLQLYTIIQQIPQLKLFNNLVLQQNQKKSVSQLFQHKDLTEDIFYDPTIYKFLKINPRQKILKLNNLFLTNISSELNINKLLYQIDFRNGIINSIPSNVIERYDYSSNGYNNDVFESQKAVFQSVLNKRRNNVNQKIVITFLAKAKTEVPNNLYTLKVQVNNDTYIIKEFVLVNRNKFNPVVITIDGMELPDFEMFTMFKIIIDERLEIKNLLVYEYDKYRTIMFSTYPTKISNVLISPFGIQTLKKLKVIADFTRLDTLDYQELQRFMDFTPPNGQTPTYAKYITIKDEQNLGPQYFDILYYTDYPRDSMELVNGEIQNIPPMESRIFPRPTKPDKSKKYKTKVTIRKIYVDPNYKTKIVNSIYQGFFKDGTILVNRCIGFGDCGYLNWYPNKKVVDNISTNFETWESPVFGFGTERILPEFIYFHSPSIMLNPLYPDYGINSKFQTNSLELYEVNDDGIRINVTPLIQINNPLLYYLYRVLIREYGRFVINIFDIKLVINNGEKVYTIFDTLPPRLPESRIEQTNIDRTIKFNYNQNKQEFKLNSSNDYVLIDLVEKKNNPFYLHFKLQSTEEQVITIEMLDNNSNVVNSQNLVIISDYTRIYLPFSTLITSNNVRKIKIKSNNSTVVTIKDLSLIEVDKNQLPLDYLKVSEIPVEDNITSTDNITKSGIDWLTYFYNLDLNTITENQFESLILPQNGVHVFKRNLDELKKDVTYTIYCWIKNNYSGVKHQIITHDDSNYELLQPTVVVEHDGWELIKTEYTPKRNVNCSYVIFRDTNNYNTDVFISGVSVFENPYNLPLLNSPQQCYQDNQYIEFSDIYLPNKSTVYLDFSHYKNLSNFKSVILEMEDSVGTTIQFYVYNNQFFIYDKNGNKFLGEINLSETQVYRLIMNIQLPNIKIQILDKSTEQIIFDKTIEYNELQLDDLVKIRLGDSKNSITDVYSFNYIGLNIVAPY